MTDMVSCQLVYNDHSDTHIGGSAIGDVHRFNSLFQADKRL